MKCEACDKEEISAHPRGGFGNPGENSEETFCDECYEKIRIKGEVSNQ